MWRTILAVPLLLGMTGCVAAWYDAYWFKSDGTEQEFARAEFDCEQSSFARYPPISLGRPGYFSSNQSFCSPTPAGPNCVLINPGYLPQARSANDTNDLPREKEFTACMIARGWRPEVQPGGFVRTPLGVSYPSRDAVRAARNWCASHLKRGSRGPITNDALDECIVNRANRTG